jgi:hypothetical protein
MRYDPLVCDRSSTRDDGVVGVEKLAGDRRVLDNKAVPR